MAYFTAVLAREGRRWTPHDLDVEAASGLDDLSAELRALADDDAPVLLLVEREDAWWGVVRIDGEEDPRVFVSDVAGAAASPYSAVLEVPVDADEEVEEEDDEPGATCGGDFDLLSDLGTSADELHTMCDDELLPMDALSAIAEGAGFAEVLDSLR